MLNLFKANLYRFFRNKKYLKMLFIALMIGIILTITAFSIPVTVSGFINQTNNINVEIYFTIINSILLIIVPLVIINFISMRYINGMVDQEIMLVGSSAKIILSDLLCTAIISFVSALVFYLIISFFIPIIGIELTHITFIKFLRIIATTTCELIALSSICSVLTHMYKSTFMGVILIFIITSGLSFVAIRFILTVIGFKYFSELTLSGIIVGYLDWYSTIRLCALYTLGYNLLSMLIFERKNM